MKLRTAAEPTLKNYLQDLEALNRALAPSIPLLSSPVQNTIKGEHNWIKFFRLGGV